MASKKTDIIDGLRREAGFVIRSLRAGTMVPALCFCGGFFMCRELNGKFLVAPESDGPSARSSRSKRLGIPGREPDPEVTVDSRPGDPREASYFGHAEALAGEEHPNAVPAQDRTTGRIRGLTQSHSFLNGKFQNHAQNSEIAG